MKNVNEVVRKLNINVPSIQPQPVIDPSQSKQSIFGKAQINDNSDYDFIQAQRKTKKKRHEADAKVTIAQQIYQYNNRSSTENEQKRSQKQGTNLAGSHLKTSYQNYIKNTNSAIYSNQSMQASKINNRNTQMSDRKEDIGRSQVHSNIIKKSKIYENVSRSKELNFNENVSYDENYNGPCKCWLKIKIYWLDSKKDIKLPVDFKFIAELQNFQPNNHLWKKALIQKIKQENPIVRSDAQIQLTYYPRQSVQNRINFDIVGILTQKIFNIEDYQIKYDQIVDNHVLGLKITNQHGSIIWYDAIDLLPLDFKDSQFSIQKNTIIVCTDSPLNCRCLVKFNKLPDDTRKMIMLEGNQNNAFDKLNKKVHKTSQGNFKLIDIKMQNNKQSWQMQVTRFP